MITHSPNFKPLDVFDCGSTSLHIVAKYYGVRSVQLSEPTKKGVEQVIDSIFSTSQSSIVIQGCELFSFLAFPCGYPSEFPCPPPNGTMWYACSVDYLRVGKANEHEVAHMKLIFVNTSESFGENVFKVRVQFVGGLYEHFPFLGIHFVLTLRGFAHGVDNVLGTAFKFSLVHESH